MPMQTTQPGPLRPTIIARTSVCILPAIPNSGDITNEGLKTRTFVNACCMTRLRRMHA